MTKKKLNFKNIFLNCMLIKDYKKREFNLGGHKIRDFNKNLKIKFSYGRKKNKTYKF